ncbi:hypothetical protein RND81_01G192300 [Saponaria officinalis]|uniref:C2 domain-containing protein n=1 Tax=Saponaria officinalis TaxID=3572 RepID=A0AAW1N8M8_SAPOF
MRNPPPLPPSAPTPSQQPPQKPSHLLEINLISAQNLKQPSTNLRRLQTYAVVYIDSNFKLRTRVDHVGAENPTWNDKFIFRVSDDFLRRETSAVTVDIFAVGVIKDALLGSVRFLISNVISTSIQRHIPAFFAVHVRRPSGRFHGVLNIGAVVIDVAEMNSSLSAVSAIGYLDMMGKNRRRKCHRRGMSEASSGSESWGGDSVDLSDGTESTGSTNSTSTTTSSSILKELNGRNDEREGRILCGLGFQKKLHPTLSDDDIKAFGALNLNSS